MLNNLCIILNLPLFELLVLGNTRILLELRHWLVKMEGFAPEQNALFLNDILKLVKVLQKILS